MVFFICSCYANKTPNNSQATEVVVNLSMIVVRGPLFGRSLWNEALITASPQDSPLDVSLLASCTLMPTCLQCPAVTSPLVGPLRSLQEPRPPLVLSKQTVQSPKYVHFRAMMLFVSQFYPMFSSRSMSAFFTILEDVILRIILEY